MAIKYGYVLDAQGNTNPLGATVAMAADSQMLGGKPASDYFLSEDAENLGGVQMELLWENASPTSSFVEQSINLNIDPSDVFCIETAYTGTAGKQFFIIREPGTTLLNAVFVYNNDTYSLITRVVTFSASNGSVTFLAARNVFYENGTRFGTDNTHFIPVRIYKVTGVFE